MFRQGIMFLLAAGQVFYENPNDIHSVSMNASDTEPARILVYFLTAEGAPITEPVASTSVRYPVVRFRSVH